MSNAILALDIGSSSVRAMVCDYAGNPFNATMVKAEYQFDRTGDGGATLDADAACETIFGCIDRALASAHGLRITHVAVDTFVTSMMGVDSEGQATTRLYTWADGRGGEHLAYLQKRLGAAAYHQRTGCYLHPSYWPLRLAWLREAEPDAFARTSRWLSFGAYLYSRVSGRYEMSVSDAAWTGLLDRRALAWDTETLAVLGITPKQVPDIDVIPAAIQRRVTGTFIQRWPQLADARWHPAIGDGMASNIGAGCTQPNQVALAVGTSGALRVIVDGTPDTVPDGLFCYRIDARRSLVGGALSNAGSVYHWLTNTLNLAQPHALENEIMRMTPDAHGLTVLPFLSPERAPYWDDSLPAALVGMTAATAPVDMLRAGLEAVAYGFARVAARLLPLLPENVSFTANGGAVQSPALMQILADVIGHPIAVATMPEATIRGAALLAGGGNAAHDAPSALYLPDISRREIYTAAMARQDVLLRRFMPR